MQYIRLCQVHIWNFQSCLKASQSSAVIDSRPVPWKKYSLNQFSMPSAYDLDLLSGIVFENGTIKRLPNTQNSCVNDTLQAKADSGNGADNMHDDSDTPDEYVIDYLHNAQKYRINHPRNCNFCLGCHFLKILNDFGFQGLVVIFTILDICF